MGKIIDLEGKRFGFLIVKKFIERKNGHTWWLCECDCGKNTITCTNRLRSGETKSCGCYYKNGKYRIKLTDDERRLHRIYNCMMSRCYKSNNSSFKNYGKKGITVCDEWKNNIDNFVKWAIKNGYKENLSIDRINNNGNYEPSNCRWATRKQQNNNTTKNVYIEFNNKIQTLSQWADEIGITGTALKYRLKKMTIEQALTTRKMRNKKCLNV